MELVKAIHVYSAYITGLGFLFRGVLSILQNPILNHQAMKKLPHIVDTALFVSGLTMIVNWAIWPASQLWLLAKLVALFFYVLFGLIMLRWGNTARNRWIGLLGGMIVYFYIVGAAHSKSVISIFSFF